VWGTSHFCASKAFFLNEFLEIKSLKSSKMRSILSDLIEELESIIEKV